MSKAPAAASPGASAQASGSPDAGAQQRLGNQGALERIQGALQGLATQAVNPLESGAQSSLAGLRRKISASWFGNDAFAPVEAAPELDRAVLMVPGFTMGSDSYAPMAQHLASNPKNGPVAIYVASEGVFRRDSMDGALMRDEEVKGCKIFVLEYRSAFASSTEKAPQIGDVLRVVSRTSGKPVDVVTHSAGGHDFRTWLNSQKGDKDEHIDIGNLVMLAPVTHGTSMGNLGAAAGMPLGVTEGASQLAIGSPEVAHLDEAWSEDSKKIGGSTSIVGVGGAPTWGLEGAHSQRGDSADAEMGWESGDGFVQTNDLGLPGADVTTLQGDGLTPLVHLLMVGYSGVINETQKGLKKPVPSKGAGH